MRAFKITKNKYLDRDVAAFYSRDYKGYQKEGNPDFINHLKNPSKKSEMELVNDFIEAYETIKTELKAFREKFGKNFTVCCVPRSKADGSYKQSQLMFRKVVSCAADNFGFADGKKAIKRIKDTRTTHNWHLENNTGDAPYCGITKDTCKFDEKLIKGRDIILVDDVYTEGVNVVEDCIQALFDFGAKNVILYAVAKVS